MTEQTGWTVLDAVDELTLPRRRKESQDIIEDGKIVGQQKITVEQPPLLTQLQDAIRSSMGGSTGGASLAHEGSPLDADALFKFIKIASMIGDWCNGLKIQRTKDPLKDLRAWYVASMRHPQSAEADTFHIKMMNQWVGTIRIKLDPWRERELPDECPMCGAKSWWRDGAEYFRPLVIKYKPTGSDMIQQARGICRSCEQVWSVRELAYELEQKETRHTEQAVVDSATSAA